MIECEICQEHYQEGHLESHQETCVLQIVFRCSICNEDYASIEGMWNHLYQHKVTEDSKESNYQEIEVKHKLHQCGLCNDQRVYSENSYWMHVRNFHDSLLCVTNGTKSKESQARFACDNCEEIFPLEETLVRHKLTKHTEPKYQCAYCSQKFHLRNQFEVHEASCKNSEHMCELCDQTFHSMSRLELHKKLFHCVDRLAQNANTESIDGAMSPIPHETIATGQEMTTSSACTIIFDSADEAAEHGHSHGHKSKPIVTELSECHESGMDEEHQEQEENLIDADEKVTHSWECQICGQEFESTKELTNHTIYTHTERRHKCTFCQKKFYYASQLRRHKRGCSILRCHVCDIKFSLHSQLVNHNMDKHPPESKSQLVTTQAAAEIENGIKVEEEVQNNEVQISIEHPNRETSPETPIEQDLKCLICGRVFSSKGKLTYHNIVIHTASRHQCSICQKKFHFSQHLRRHEADCSKQLNNHNTEKAICPEKPKKPKNTQLAPQNETIELDLNIKVEDTEMQDQEYHDSNETSLVTNSIPQQHAKTILPCGTNQDAHQDDVMPGETRIEKPEEVKAHVAAINSKIQCWMAGKNIKMPEPHAEVHVLGYRRAAVKCWYCSKPVLLSTRLLTSGTINWIVANFTRHILSHLPHGSRVPKYGIIYG